MSCDPNDLSKAAACWERCIPPGMQAAVQNFLLCQIAFSAGSNGLQQIFAGDGGPTTQVPAFNAGIYWDFTNRQQYNWNPVLLRWE